jgi:hypothetical protein
MLSADVGGAQELAELGKRLRGADKQYRKELRIGLNRATKPLKEQVKSELPTFLPAGYAKVMRKALKPKTVIRTGGLAAVRIVASAKGRHKNRDVRALDKGTLRHPLWGNREFWYAQKIRSGFWSEPMRDGKARVRAEVMDVIRTVNRRIVGGS